jgi:hypothetical protein
MAVRGKGAASAAPDADTAAMQLHLDEIFRHVVADAPGHGGKKTACYGPRV